MQAVATQLQVDTIFIFLLPVSIQSLELDWQLPMMDNENKMQMHSTDCTNPALLQLETNIRKVCIFTITKKASTRAYYW